MLNKLKSYEINENNLFNLSLFVLFLLILSKGGALFHFGYSIDTYATLATEYSPNFSHVLSMGRIGGVALGWMLHVLGIEGVYPYIVGAILGYIALGMMAVAICKPFFTSDSRNSFSALLGIGIAICHPYLSEIFTFRGEALINFSVALIFGVTGYLIVDKSTKSVIYGGILIALGLTLYQIFLNYLAVAWAFSLLVSIRIDKDGVQRAEMISLDMKRLSAIFLGVSVYFFVLKIVAMLTGVTAEGRAQFITLNDLPERFVLVAKTIWDIFTGKSLSGQYYSWWFGVILFCTMVSMIRLRKISTILISFAILIFALFSVVGLLALSKDFWAVPRTLSASAFFIAGCVAYATSFSPKPIRRFVIAISVVATVGFAGISNKIFVDQQRLNERDKALASRIVMRLETLPRFAEIGRIAIVGGRWGYPFGFYTVWGDLNISAFAASWSKLNILREVSGYDFGGATVLEEKEAQNYCISHPYWPAIEAVTQIGNLGIICLEKIS